MAIKKTRKIYLADTDATGFVYYARYLEWMEADRVDILLETGLNLDDLKQQNINAVVKSTTCNYNAPLKMGDEVEVTTYISKLAKTNLKFSYKFNNLTTGMDAGSAEVLIVFIDSQTFRPTRIPENCIEYFSRHLMEEQPITV